VEAVIATREDIEQLAIFLANCNSIKTQNIGYVGYNVESLIDALQQDFLKTNGDLSFVMMKDDLGKVIGAIGLDMDEEVAEVWGPFSTSSDFVVEEKLWCLLVQKYPEIKEFKFFINVENEKQQKFITQLGATNTGEHCILVIQKDNFVANEKIELLLYKDENYADFEQLHSKAFPNTYYNAQTIVSRISKNNQLLVMIEDNEFIGYAYFEVEPMFKEASLEYIAIDPKYQNKGYGTKLLTKVIQQMFDFPEINDLILCVSTSNQQANRVYEKVGFQNKSVLRSYKLTLV